MSWLDIQMERLEAFERSGGHAEMVPGTKCFDGQRYFVVIKCSKCSHREFIAFAGWSAILCGGCRSELKRTPYRGVQS